MVILDDKLERQSVTASVRGVTIRTADQGATLARQLASVGFATSNIVDNLPRLPRFSPQEVHLGAILGRGSFGTVYEARALDADDDEAPDDDGPRQFLAKHCVRESSGEARYAVKCLNGSICDDPTLFPQALLDMAHETRYMAALEHPHICKIRAMSSTGPFDKDYFIVLDRLYDTLNKRIGKWKKMMKRQNGRWSALSCIGDVDEDTTIRRQQLRVSYDLSSAMAFIHQNNIVYRDLKPQNIGFDIRNDVKLFDFGISREFKRADRLEDDTYNLTIMTGSPRYMAPEVANCKTYNEKCDCYSFALLLWQIYSLKTPYKNYDTSSMADKVWNKPFNRPSIPEEWSFPIRHLLKRAWNHDISIRPDMRDIAAVLRLECLEEDDYDEQDLSHDMRRSTFVYRRGRTNRDLMPRSDMAVTGKCRSVKTILEQEGETGSVSSDILDKPIAFSMGKNYSLDANTADGTERTHIQDP